ncbi:MAG: transglutaminase family protein [Bacteroidales bacterium]|nr:transglutaminase family protein [Bacteroidales bacterium]
MERKELIAMISLLDDNDNEIINAITQSLLGKGSDIIPELERAWEAALDDKIQERLGNLIQEIQFAALKEDLKRWVHTGSANILEGAFYVAKFNFPDISFDSVDLCIENIRKDVWLEINDNLTALEKVKIINFIMFQIHKFGRNPVSFHAPQNSYINQVIESRKGNPVSLAIVYLSVAWKLGLPIYGVNLPKNFLIAYKDEYRQYDAQDQSEDILFYINPFNKGAVLGRREIDYFITQQQLEPLQSYYEPCSNRDIIIRLINDLIVAYEKLGNIRKIEKLRELLSISQS